MPAVGAIAQLAITQQSGGNDVAAAATLSARASAGLFGIGQPVDLGAWASVSGDAVITIPPNGGIPAGSTIILAVGNVPLIIPTITDSKGNTYSVGALSVPNGVPTNRGYVYLARSIATALAPGDTITISDGNGTSIGVAAFWIRGLQNAGIHFLVDTFGSSTTPSATTSAPADPETGEFYLGVIFYRGSTADTFAQSAGWTSPSPARPAAVGGAVLIAGMGYLIASGADAQTYAPTLGTSREWGDLIVVLKRVKNPTVISTPQGFVRVRGGITSALTAVRTCASVIRATARLSGTTVRTTSAAATLGARAAVSGTARMTARAACAVGCRTALTGTARMLRSCAALLGARAGIQPTVTATERASATLGARAGEGGTATAPPNQSVATLRVIMGLTGSARVIEAAAAALAARAGLSATVRATERASATLGVRAGESGGSASERIAATLAAVVGIIGSARIVTRGSATLGAVAGMLASIPGAGRVIRFVPRLLGRKDTADLRGEIDR